MGSPRMVVALLGGCLVGLGCGAAGGAPGEVCAQGEFQLIPTGGTQYEVRREVCYHSESLLGNCPFFDYRIPPSTDFSEFVDIFFGGPVPECQQSMLGEFIDFSLQSQSSGQYMFFGTPTRAPPTTPTASNQTVATGTYNFEFGTEGGNFEFYWPAR